MVLVFTLVLRNPS